MAFELVIDSYLKTLKSESTGVEVFGWEEFEKGVGKRKVEQLLQGKGNLLQQNAVFFPSNSLNSKHWFLGVALPMERVLLSLIVCLGNSLSQQYPDG